MEEPEEDDTLAALEEARQFADNVIKRHDNQQDAQEESEMQREETEMPRHEAQDTVYVKYRTEADVPTYQTKYFDAYRGAFGRHVALSNTFRNDNPRHLNSLDLQFLYDDMPTLRQNAEQRRIRETAEFQMCRSNPEVGGFEAKIGSTIIRRDTVDLKQAQTLTQGMGGKKHGILSFLRRK
jgi:hypothetical protein